MVYFDIFLRGYITYFNQSKDQKRVMK